MVPPRLACYSRGKWRLIFLDTRKCESKANAGTKARVGGTPICRRGGNGNKQWQTSVKGRWGVRRRNKDVERGVVIPIEGWLGQRTSASVFSRFRLFEDTCVHGDPKISTALPFRGGLPSLSRSFPWSRLSKTNGANCTKESPRRLLRS